MTDYAEKKVRNRDQFVRSSLREVEGAGRFGAKRRPQNPYSLVQRFSSWTYACAMLNARAIASVPLRLYASPPSGRTKALASVRPVPISRKRYVHGDGQRRPSKSVMLQANRGGDDIVEVLDHPLIDLLQGANPWMNGYNMTVLRMIYLQITGNAYLHPIYGSSGVPEELWVMPSQWVEIIPEREGGVFVEGYVYGKPPGESIFAPDEVLHSKVPDPADMHYGRGWVHAACNAIDLGSAMDEYERALFDNMARPDWGIFVKEQMSQDQFDRLEADIDEHLRGTRKQGRPYIFEGGSDARPLQWSPRDLAFEKGEERVVERIAAIAGVPVTKLLANDPNLSNAELGDYGWMKDTIAPYCIADEEFLNQSLVPHFDGYDEGLFLAYDDPVPQDAARDATIAVADVQAGIRTINERRAEIGLEPIEGGDVLRINGVPIDLVGQAPDPFGGFLASMDRGSLQAGEEPRMALPGPDDEPDDREPAAAPAATQPPAEAPDALPANVASAESLNGAQITAASGIISSLRSGDLGPETAIELLLAVGLSEDAARRMVAETSRLPAREEVSAAAGGTFRG